MSTEKSHDHIRVFLLLGISVIFKVQMVHFKILMILINVLIYVYE